jgi:hypothetical protein
MKMKTNVFQPLPVAVRAFSAPNAPRSNRTRNQPHTPDSRSTGASRPRAWLPLDTETRIDPGQGFTFGVYQYLRAQETFQEGLIYADDLPETDPEGFRVLQEYVRTREANVSRRSSRRLRLLSRSEFVRKVLVRAINRADATTVGFNLPFDISRLAVGHGEARRNYEGGFSFVLSDYEEA